MGQLPGFQIVTIAPSVSLPQDAEVSITRTEFFQPRTQLQSLIKDPETGLGRRRKAQRVLDRTTDTVLWRIVLEREARRLSVGRRLVISFAHDKRIDPDLYQVLRGMAASGVIEVDCPPGQPKPLKVIRIEPGETIVLKMVPLHFAFRTWAEQSRFLDFLWRRYGISEGKQVRRSENGEFSVEYDESVASRIDEAYRSFVGNEVRLNSSWSKIS